MAVVICADCSGTFHCHPRNVSQVSRCGECQTKHTRELNRLRNRLLRPGSINGLPQYLSCHPKRCQICGVGSPRMTAPDGSGVPCCVACYDDCCRIMEAHSKGLGPALVLDLSRKFREIAMGYADMPDVAPVKAEREVRTICPLCQIEPKRVCGDGRLAGYCSSCSTIRKREHRAAQKAVAV